MSTPFPAGASSDVATPPLFDTWTQELDDLSRILGNEHRERVGRLHSDVLHEDNLASYVRTHSESLAQEVSDPERYLALLASPNFLSAFSTVCRYDEMDDRPNSREDYDELYKKTVFLESVLEAVGYQWASSHFPDWAYRHGTQSYSGIAHNIGAIAGLERERPGATSLLSDFYGLRHFSRYPTELLVDQFDQHGEADRPFGILVSAVLDYNGAFTNPYNLGFPVPAHIYPEVKPTHDMKVLEVKSEAELEQRLVAIGELSGRIHKIGFGVIQAHGDPTAIYFGHGQLNADTNLEGVRLLFENNASLLLDSCSTGVLGGIAQIMSENLGISVVGPVADCAIKIVRFTHDNNGARLIPEFMGEKGMLDQTEESIEAAMYINGRPATDEQRAAYFSS